MYKHGKFSLVGMAAERLMLSEAWRMAVIKLARYKASNEMIGGRKLARHCHVVRAAARGEVVSEAAFVYAADFIVEEAARFDSEEERVRLASEVTRALRDSGADWLE